MSLFDSASLVVTPNGVKEGKLYSIKPSDGSGDLSVTRATTATRVNSAGLVEVVPYNLLTYSNTFSNANWGKTSVSVTSGQSGYDGALNAWLLASTTTPTAYLSQSITVNVNSLFSVYLKKGTLDWAMFLTSGTTFANFDLNNGVLGSLSNCTATIESVGNGWYKCTIKPSIAGVNVRIYPANGDNTRTTTGNILIQNAQLEESSSAKPYFPTTDRLNIPRLDYTNGSCPSILVEPQRTNLCLRSEEFDNAYWLKANTSVTANTTISPDGTQTADTLLATSGMTSFLYRSFILTVGTPYTFSIYVKKKTITALGNRFRINFVNNLFVNFNGSVPVITGGSGIIENVGNEFYRIITTITPSVTSNVLYIYPDGNNNNADEYYIWGAQLEAGSNATSYIPTTSATVTRNADVISKTGISSLIGQTEGTIFIETQPLQSLISDGVTRSLFSINENSLSSNLFYLRRINNNYILNVISLGVTLATPTIFTYSNINLNKLKIAIKYGSNTLKVFVNGINTVNQTISSIPSTNTLTLGSNRLNGDILDGRIDLFQLYKTSLSDQECINLTTL